MSGCVEVWKEGQKGMDETLSLECGCGNSKLTGWQNRAANPFKFPALPINAAHLS